MVRVDSWPGNELTTDHSSTGIPIDPANVLILILLIWDRLVGGVAKRKKQSLIANSFDRSLGIAWLLTDLIRALTNTRNKYMANKIANGIDLPIS